MKCIQCNNEFEPKRKTARYCSDVCRVKASRGVESETKESSVAPEKEKKDIEPMFETVDEQILNLHCSECVTFESGVHWCPNKECGCFETKEEQEASLEAFQRTCLHPKEETFMQRCLCCGRIRLVTAMSGKHMSKELCAKHNGAYKSSCGCKAKEE